MGTTAVVAISGPGGMMVGHIGDSRAYLIRDGRLQRLTRDHTLGQALIASGDMTAEQVAEHSGLLRLTHYIGMRHRPGPEVTTVTFTGSDRLLLCSDGLTSIIDDSTLLQILDAHPHPDDACRALVEAANRAGVTTTSPPLYSNGSKTRPSWVTVTVPTVAINGTPPLRAATCEGPAPLPSDHPGSVSAGPSDCSRVVLAFIVGYGVLVCLRAARRWTYRRR